MTVLVVDWWLGIRKIFTLILILTLTALTLLASRYFADVNTE